MERRILVVEDSPTQAESLRLLLEREGYRVDVATNGREGLERLQEKMPDLIISDVVMPEMDGYAFCHAVKSAKRTKGIPVVLLTQRNAAEDILMGLERGADNFITKPFDDDYLLERLRRIFEHLELRKKGQLEMEVTLRVGVREIVITADKQQIIELVFSTLEEVSRLNVQLLEAKQMLEDYSRNLEVKVQERTEALRSHAERLKTLHEIDRAILASQSSEAIAQAALHHIRHLVPCLTTSVALFDLAAQEAVLLAAHPNSGGRVGPGSRLSLEEFGAVAVLREGRVDRVEDMQRLSRLLPLDQALQAEGTRSYIRVPLTAQEELIGALTLGAEAAGGFTPEHVDIAREVADQLAIAIQQASLHEQIRRHAMELEQCVADRTAELRTANQHLQDASRHKSEFLANMSHELRTPLNSIIGFADLLLNQGVGPLSDKQGRYLGHILQGGQHLLQLISDILDLSKVEAGKFVLQPEALTVGTILDDILVIARGLANKKSQTIQADVGPDLPPLQADPVRFKQILFNLLSNAVKFTPEQGNIAVTARKVDQSTGQGVDSSRPVGQLTTRPFDTNGEWLEIAVTDTGVGIKAEDMPRLFQEFVQLETTRDKRQEGTGLGLALTKRLVEMHGGRIRAESEGKDKGSTFTVCLPFNQSDGGGADQATMPPLA